MRLRGPNLGLRPVLEDDPSSFDYSAGKRDPHAAERLSRGGQTAGAGIEATMS